MFSGRAKAVWLGLLLLAPQPLDLSLGLGQLALEGLVGAPRTSPSSGSPSKRQEALSAWCYEAHAVNDLSTVEPGFADALFAS
jgi:hypothetical protein